MMTYRDMAFCQGNGCLSAPNCHRYLTGEIWAKAQAANMPLAVIETPEEMRCYVAPKPDSTTTDP
jgi:hypothetical protein